MSNSSVLTAEDLQALIRRSLRRQGFHIRKGLITAPDPGCKDQLRRLHAVSVEHNLRRSAPDVLVIDISMPVLDGLQAVSQLHRGTCRTKFVFLTVHEDQDYVDAALAAGASAYVTKSHVASDLVPAIREALQGRTFVSKSITP